MRFAILAAAACLSLAACASQAPIAAKAPQAAAAPAQPEPLLFPLPINLTNAGKMVSVTVDADGQITGDIAGAREALKLMPRSCGIHCLIVAMALRLQDESGAKK